MTLSKPQKIALAESLDTLAHEMLDKVGMVLPQTADEKALEQAGVVLDAVDESTVKTHDELRHAMLEHLLCELRKVETARTRLAQGELDRCVDCDNSIDYERLRANPLATRCIHCQTRYETAHRNQDMLRL